MVLPMPDPRINPRVRYARALSLNKSSVYAEVVPLDARLFYTLSGSGIIRISGTEYEMLPASLLIIPAGTPYRLLTPETSVTYIAINFDYTQNRTDCPLPVPPVPAKKYDPSMLLEPATVFESKLSTSLLYIPALDALQSRMLAIVEEYTRKFLYYEFKTGHLLAECLVDCMRFQEIGGTDREKDPSSLLLSYVQEHFSENLTNRTIGILFGYHPNYVSALIKRATGMPVHRYILHVRLMNAANLLENTNLSIGQIAGQCGFCDTAYFSGYFKKHFGISPSQYRNS